MLAKQARKQKGGTKGIEGKGEQTEAMVSLEKFEF